MLGRSCQGEDDCQRQEDWLHRLRRVEPDLPPIEIVIEDSNLQLLKRAFQAYARGKYAIAIDYLKAYIIEIGYYNAAALTDLATFYRLSGEISEAEKIYKFVLSKTPKHGAAWFGLGNCHMLARGSNVAEILKNVIYDFEKAVSYPDCRGVEEDYKAKAREHLETHRRKLEAYLRNRSGERCAQDLSSSIREVTRKLQDLELGDH